MLLVTGKVLGYTEQNKGYTDKATGAQKSFVSRVIHMLDGVHTEQLELSRDFDTTTIPNAGDECAIEVWARGSGGRVYFTAVRVVELKSGNKAA